MQFQKEEILPSTNSKSPFYQFLPNLESKPIDELVIFFKKFKNLIKNLINYLKEISLTKEFESNLNYQIFNSYYSNLLNIHNNSSSSIEGGIGTGGGSGSGASSPGLEKRPNLFKSKSNPNQTFKTEKKDKGKLFNNSLTTTKSNISINPTNNAISTGTNTSGANGGTGVGLVGGEVLSNFKISEDSPFFENANSLILNHHYHLYQLKLKQHKELVNKLIPRLENLNKNLSNKIREIKSSLKNESFVNDSIKKEISKTGSLLTKYIKSIEYYNTTNTVTDIYDDIDDPEDNGIGNDDEEKVEDPFLIKLKLNYQLKNQLIKENYLFAAFVNLQNISKDLMAYIIKDLNLIFEKLEKFSNVNISKLNFNIQTEWEKFILNSDGFLNIYKDFGSNQRKEIRHFKDLKLPYSNSIHNKCIRFGIIYKKLKLLKNYNRYYYLLTCNYLHEFKIEPHQNQNQPQNSSVGGNKNKLALFINHNDIPEKSYDLNNYKISIRSNDNLKFNLTKISSGKNYSFKCNNLNDYNHWVTDLNDLLKFENDFKSRFQFVEKKLSVRPTVQPSNSLTSIITPVLPIDSKNGSEMSISESQSTINSSGSLTPSIQLPVTIQNNQGSLQGIFTPNIRTPSSSESDKNPFDQSFLTNPNSQHQIGSGGTHSGSNSKSNSPNQSSGNVSTSNNSKLQQEFLKQQQEIIAKKLREIDLKMKQPQNHQLQNHQPQNELSNSGHVGYLGHNKNDSISSFNSLESLKSLNPSKINNFLNDNQGLIVPKFFINDEEKH